ncbi:PorT family protein [Hymenobacter gummosus]|uniref:PorT family protein n=1 Tax=Hymenobacter gummosus TaxID=1776032 RepID=A0A3S0J5D5_9BACT|nr:porin family protein [Hymenobacter gummosus]RTQ44902.1 PorT family protein [Hymenobacter gummosus]
MKSTLLRLLPALLLSQAASAQQLHFGAKAGANYSDSYQRNVAPESTTAIFGYSLGALSRYSFGQDKFWNIQVELLYSRKGDDYQYPGQRPGGQRRLSYLELPVLAKINVQRIGFEAGPQLGYLVAARFTNPITGVGTTRDLQGLRRLLLGYVAGAGYELPSGYSFTLRYNGDFLPITQGGGFFQSPAHSVFQAQLGYLLSKRE